MESMEISILNIYNDHKNSNQYLVLKSLSSLNQKMENQKSQAREAWLFKFYLLVKLYII